MPQPVLQLRQTVLIWLSALRSAAASAGVSSPASARARIPRARSSCEAASAPQPIAVVLRKSRRLVPLPLAMDHLQLLVGDVADARLGPGAGVQELRRARLLRQRDEALRVALVAEEGRPPDAGRDAGRELAGGEPVGAEVALARLADRQRLAVTRPRRAVLEGRLRLVGLRPARVHRAAVDRPGAVGACLRAGPAPHALRVVDRHRPRGDPLRLLPGRPAWPLLRAGLDAGRLVALHAGTRDERPRDLWVLPALLLEDA